MKRIIFASLLCLIARQAWAGDAIAMGFRYDGVWTALTYFRSLTPKGGLHYWTAAQACSFARRDLHKRASEDLARTEIIGQSDRTGYVAIARAHLVNANKGIAVIGRGKSQREADENALKKLNRTEPATTNAKIVFRYFSYGADSQKASTDKSPRRVGSGRTLKSRA